MSQTPEPPHAGGAFARLGEGGHADRLDVRLVLGILIFLYLGAYAVFGEQSTVVDPRILYPMIVAVAGFIVAVLLLVNILLYQGESAIRRSRACWRHSD